MGGALCFHVGLGCLFWLFRWLVGWFVAHTMLAGVVVGFAGTCNFRAERTGRNAVLTTPRAKIPRNVPPIVGSINRTYQNKQTHSGCGCFVRLVLLEIGPFNSMG